jgi:DNA repair exonuclease SbcCD nuclease subunit
LPTFLTIHVTATHSFPCIKPNYGLYVSLQNTKKHSVILVVNALNPRPENNVYYYPINGESNYRLKAFSFVHAADLHLGYAQYGLEVRRQDFDNAFREIVDKTLDLKADFMIIAGDLFHQARPSNVTLENTIRSFKQLRDAGIPVLTVDGSHDSAPNSITSTILYPLDSAGLIHHLPRHEGACWRKPDCCYVYGVPNFRSRRKTEEVMPVFMQQNVPAPDLKLSNIFVFHAAVDLPSVKPAYIEAEIPPELLP